MREVVPGLVWLGNARDTRDVRGVMSQEIRAVVDLALEEPPGTFPREIIYCRFPILDGAGNPHPVVDAAISTLAALFKANLRTLVTCNGGMSRSPAFAAAALYLANGGSLDDCLKQIAVMGPHDVSPGLWMDVSRVVGDHH